MMTPIATTQTPSSRMALTICIAAMLSLAVAMGVGRFAFTPLFPLMVRDGLLGSEAGAMIAASNYLGYLLGALGAAKIRVKPATLMAWGLICTVGVTVSFGYASSFAFWALLRFVAGVMSAWTLVATSAWGLNWLAAHHRPDLAGPVFSGVGVGIAAAGCFCLVAAGPEISSLSLWIALGGLAGIATLIPFFVSHRFPAPVIAASGQPAVAPLQQKPDTTRGLIIAYGLFGFGYILPATYLPTLARQLVDDPQLFGLAWPLFGGAAAVSTIVVSFGLKSANRLKVWALSHLLMAGGVLLPTFWASLISVSMAALLVGGTFMVITMIAMQEARSRAEGNATLILGRMTAGFAFGQLMGPVVSATLLHFTADFSRALHYALTLSAAGLLLSAFYLWRTVRCHGTP